MNHETFLRPRLCGRRFETRLEELARLEDGWLNEQGRAPDPESLRQLAEKFDERFSPDLPLPYLYPTPEGNIQAEWSLGNWEVSLEINLPDLTAEYQAVHVVTGKSEDLELSLAELDDSSWTRLNEALAHLLESQA